MFKGNFVLEQFRQQKIIEKFGRMIILCPHIICRMDIAAMMEIIPGDIEEEEEKTLVNIKTISRKKNSRLCQLCADILVFFFCCCDMVVAMMMERGAFCYNCFLERGWWAVFS